MLRSLLSLLGWQGSSNRSLQDVKVDLSLFNFDREGVERPYSTRLQEKTGWDRSFTERVIREYRRFLLLAWDAAARNTVAVPSESVDEAWHLHLQDTRSYWTLLCKDVLHREIHHFPSESASSDSQYKHLYYDTLIRYQLVFGETPPEDIWGKLPQPPASPAKPKATATSLRSKSTAGNDTSSSSDTTFPIIMPMFFGGADSTPSAPSVDHGHSSPSGGDHSSPASCGSSSPASCGGGAASCGGSSGGSSGCGGGGGGCGGGGGGCGGGGG